MSSGNIPVASSKETAHSCAVGRGGADKWFRNSAGEKFFWNGITYGPFKPNTKNEPWPEESQLRTDIAHIAALGFNLVRIYELPSDLLLKICSQHGLRILAGVPWTQHVDFFANKSVQRDAIERVKQTARRLRDEPCVAGLLIGNEIEKTLVRRMGPERVRGFLEKLIAIVKAEAPCLSVSYATYPSTEHLIPRNADFIAFNVFLERREDFARYARHLQVLAGDKPLVITEFGLDTKQHGEAAQAEVLRWQNEEVRHIGAAGNFWFSYTDEWHRNGEEVTGWDFGIVTRDRKLKQACDHLPQPSSFVIRHPVFKLSVVICTHNGSATLRECLAALEKQSLPALEVLVIDDGSTDITPNIAREFAFVKYHRQEHAGLSVARNLGIKLSCGDIIAFTDDDCIPDTNWLAYLAAAFENEEVSAAGGPNLPPPPRTRTEAVIAAAPGAPAHVLADDFEAEHLPGCNLAIRRTALEAIGGFREEFTTAGDDVDVCWRLQAHGGKLLFHPAAVVWHHRRTTVTAYLRQQSGYGHAEALLMKRWPERFAWFGGARWRGMIYGNQVAGELHQRRVDHGPDGSALFPVIYADQSPRWFDGFSGLPCLLLVLLALVCGIFIKPFLLLAMFLIAASFAVAITTASRRRFNGRLGTKREFLMLSLLCWLQPVVRDSARLRGMILLRARPRGTMKYDLVRKPLPEAQP